jgi:dolichol-phosphate mannosyltransferase
MPKNGGEVLVVVPTYNECENVESIVHRIREAVPHAHVLIVDDGSPDGTGEVANRLSVEDSSVLVLHRHRKGGLGGAYLAGFARALAEGYKYVAEIDADGSHEPAELQPMLRLLEQGNDLVIGSRWVRGGSVVDWPRYRQAISRTGNRYARWALRSDISDLTAGLRIYRTDLLRQLHLHDISSQGYCFQVEMAWRAEQKSCRVVEHPITFAAREYGVSKMHAGIVIEALGRVTLWGVKRFYYSRDEHANKPIAPPVAPQARHGYDAQAACPNECELP